MSVSLVNRGALVADIVNEAETEMLLKRVSELAPCRLLPPIHSWRALPALGYICIGGSGIGWAVHQFRQMRSPNNIRTSISIWDLDSNSNYFWGAGVGPHAPAAVEQQRKVPKTCRRSYTLARKF